MSRRTRLVKVLGYRDRTGASQAAHAEHWRGFTFRSGRVQVIAVGSWGQVQVWAESEEEGKRVIRHAGAIGGWDPDTEEGAFWQVRNIASSRYRVGVLMQTMDSRQGLRVSKRQGPNGSPELNI